MARLLMASGGTGGHFYPGFSLGQALRKRGHEILYLVRAGDPALPLLVKEGFSAVELDLRGMPRGLSPKLLSFAWKLGGAFSSLSGTFQTFKPNAVIGMGSYLSFPTVLTAWSRRIPALVHESNAVLGLANRLSIPFVRTLCLGLPLSGHKKALLTGTPIREALWQPADRQASIKELSLKPGLRTVLIFGGSQGAQRMNAVFPEALAAAARKTGAVQVLHLTGAKGRAEVEASYRRLGLEASVLDYLERMEVAFAASDLVICRSGASTLAELIAQGKPSILVPFPFAAGGHQSANARLLETAGAAVRLEEAVLSVESAAGALEPLLGPQGEGLRGAMVKALSRLNVPVGQTAVEALVASVESLL